MRALGYGCLFWVSTPKYWPTHRLFDLLSGWAFVSSFALSALGQSTGRVTDTRIYTLPTLSDGEESAKQNDPRKIVGINWWLGTSRQRELTGFVVVGRRRSLSGCIFDQAKPSMPCTMRGNYARTLSPSSRPSFSGIVRSAPVHSSQNLKLWTFTQCEREGNAIGFRRRAAGCSICIKWFCSHYPYRRGRKRNRNGVGWRWRWRNMLAGSDLHSFRGQCAGVLPSSIGVRRCGRSWAYRHGVAHSMPRVCAIFARASFAAIARVVSPNARARISEVRCSYRSFIGRK